MGGQCGRCGSANRAGRRFCGQCGEPIPLVCARCEFVNQQDDRYCGGCGDALATPLSPVSRAGELRQVVVLFADLANYTRLSERLEPEDVHQLLGRFFEEVDGVVADHGGTIDKHIGDNVMALFGAPVAHGNDAERAVRAAFAMHERVAVLGQELSLELRLSIGIAAGQVMASGLGSAHHREYTVIGSSVNLAARLQGRASAGETLVDDPVYRPIEAFVDADRLDALELKGIDRPVRAWRLRALRAARAVERAPMVGRRRERAELAAALERCAGGHHGQLIALVGEAGIGKSRLAAEAVKMAGRKGLTSYRIGFVDFGGTARTVGSLVGELVDRDWLESARAADPHLHAALLDVLGHELPESLQARQAALDAGERTRARRDAIASAVADASRRMPLLIVVEDLHWCPGEELPLVAGLAHATATGAVTLIVTTRPDSELLAADSAWRAETRGLDPRELDIGPLAHDEAGQLVASLGAASSLAQEAVTRAGGNPLFLEELIASADDRLPAGGLPGTIQSLVMARLDRLPPADRTAVQIASVLGHDLDLSWLRAMLEDASYEPTALVERGLLADDPDRLSFRHALIRDGAYASLPRERRRELHARAASLLGTDDPLLRARHLDQAGDPGAVAAYLEAAAAAADARRLESALDCLERARSLAGDDMLCAVELARGDRLLALGQHRAAAEAYRAAADSARDPLDRSRAAIGEAAAHRALSSYDPALQALAEAERVLGDAPSETPTTASQRAQIHYQRASLRFAMGQLEASWDDARLALELAQRVGEPALEARALSALGDAEFATGTMTDANAAFARTLELCDTHRLTRFSVANRVMYGQTCLWLDRLDESKRALDRALADALDIRYPFGEMFARHSIGLFGQLLGDLEPARTAVARALELARELGSVRFECEFITQLAEIDFALGGDPAADVRACADLSRAQGVIEYCGPWTYGVLALVTDDSEERRAAITAGERLLERGSMRMNAILFHRLAARACDRAGEPEAVRRHAERCLEALDAYRATLQRDEMVALLAPARRV